MVHCERDAHCYWIIAEPNRSASWRVNKLILAVLGGWLLVVASIFTAAGLWLVLPFAGFEFGALGSALYWVSRRLRQRHVVHFSADRIRIEKGTRYPQYSWTLSRQAVALSVDIQNHPEDPLQLSLCTPQERIRVGDFLNLEDSRELLRLLRDSGLSVRNYSRAGQVRA